MITDKLLAIVEALEPHWSVFSVGITLGGIAKLDVVTLDVLVPFSDAVEKSIADVLQTDSSDYPFVMPIVDGIVSWLSKRLMITDAGLFNFMVEPKRVNAAGFFIEIHIRLRFKEGVL